MKLLWFNLQVNRNRQGLAFAIDWINAVADRVEWIDVITMSVGEYDVRDNVRVYSIGKEKGYSEPRRALEFYRILWTLLRQQRYDACFAHMMPLFAVMAAPLLRLKKIPLMLWYTHKSVTVILRLATAAADRVVTASQESFRIHTPKVRVIGHGIDVTKFVPLNRGHVSGYPFTMITVSRLSRIKRIELVIEALALLKQHQPDRPVRLKVIGGPLTENDRQYVAELHQHVEQYGLQKSVEFVGSVPFQAIVPCYQKADCFVSLSETGSIDKTVLEAMSCGIIVVIVPTYHDILGDELAGLFEVLPEPENIYTRLCYILSLSPEERRTIGEQLRTIVLRNHSLQKLCNRILEELQDLKKRAKI